MKINQRETKLIRASTVALSLVALCVTAYDSPRFDGPPMPEAPRSQNYPLLAHTDRFTSFRQTGWERFTHEELVRRGVMSAR